MRWISIKVTGRGDDRQSSLGIDERNPDRLTVVGRLSHYESIAPSTAADAQRLREWLDRYYPSDK